MRTIENLAAVIAAQGVPWTDTRFLPEENVVPPCIALVGSQGQHAYGDSVNIANWMEYDVEYYFVQRDRAAEKALEAGLTEAGIPYSKYINYIESEDVIEVTYTCTVQE